MTKLMYILDGTQYSVEIGKTTVLATLCKEGQGIVEAPIQEPGTRYFWKRVLMPVNHWMILGEKLGKPRAAIDPSQSLRSGGLSENSFRYIEFKPLKCDAKFKRELEKILHDQKDPYSYALVNYFDPLANERRHVYVKTGKPSMN